MNLLVLGCGNMAGAMLQAWIPHLDTGKDLVGDELASCEQQKIWLLRASAQQRENIQKHPNYLGFAERLRFFNSFAELQEAYIQAPVYFDLIVLGMKPQVLQKEFQNCLHFAAKEPEKRKKQIWLTMAAGLPCAWYQKWQGDLKLVRIMPNLGAAVGMSASLAFAPAKLSDSEKHFLEALFAQIGKFVWCEREDLLECATPVTGSGPAYFYLLCEILEGELLKSGFPLKEAELLAETTMLGAAEYMQQRRQRTSAAAEQAGAEAKLGVEADAAASLPARLRREVSSRGGVTEAALEVLQGNLPELFAEAIQWGIQRNRELQSETANQRVNKEQL